MLIRCDGSPPADQQSMISADTARAPDTGRRRIAMKTFAMDPDDNINISDSLITLRVYIPDLLIQKNFQFHKDEFIWDVKQYILDSLPKELKEGFNYGIFCPPINGKAGKFFDEHRPLADYPFHTSIGYVELRYKRRVYKMMNVEEKQIKQLHTRANLRRMLDHVTNGQIEKITKMCARGMDPNFHCPETGETPLTVASSLKQPAKVIMALINGGALLDFRTKDGLTALHKAVERNNLEALKTLLDLGASPNYKDSKGLTPLYYTLLHASDHQLTETLLHDHAFIGTCDPQGWQEVHQACKHGLVQHLENLLFYGADMNARNASGNTPLHVCAVNDQESCARVLLFRGADKDALNFANQNPYQVSVIAGNLSLGELIRNHNPEEVVPYREMPRYNPRRRASIAPVKTLCRTHSDPRLDLHMGMKPPSPCPSNCSLPPFSSISCISDTSTTTSSSTYTHPSAEESEDTASGSIVTEKSIASDSSGVCTSNSATSYDSGQDPSISHEKIVPKKLFCCIKDYISQISDHLQLSSGDIIEVIRKTDDGLLLAKTSCGQMGFVPPSYVQETESLNYNTLNSSGLQRVEGRREKCLKCISTIPRRWKMYGEPRTVILHKGKKGFGFVLRGTKASSPMMDREGIEFCPSQYLEDVNKGGVADLAGLQKGDYLLEINGQDVSQASHEHVVSVIQQSGNLVAMTVITLNTLPIDIPLRNNPFPYRQCATLPRKLIAPAPPKRDPKTTLSVGRVRAISMVAGLAELESLDHTLNEYDSEGRSTKSSSVESLPNKTGMKNANSVMKTASIKPRPSSQRVSAAELEQFFSRQDSRNHPQNYDTSQAAQTRCRPHKVYGSVAEMKRSKTSKYKFTENTSSIHKEFFSTPDLKADNGSTLIVQKSNRARSNSQEDALNHQRNRHSWACLPNRCNSHLGLFYNEDHSLNYTDAWRSIEDVYDGKCPPDSREVNSDIYSQTLPYRTSKNIRSSCPPPSYPPPPPPVGQVVTVDVSKSLGEYANVNVTDEDQDSHVMSSFRPGDSAKLYASPEIVMSVGYKSETPPATTETLQPRRTGGGSSLRSQSLPPKIFVNKSDKGSATSSEAENSGDSGGLYAMFKKTSRQRDSMSTDSGHVSDRAPFRTLKGKSATTTVYTSSKFDVEDSDVGSPHNYPTVKTPSHEPFIPEPDYESSEDDFIPTALDKGSNLSTFGKGDSEIQDKDLCTSYTSDDQVPEDNICPPTSSPHSEAKRAIQEARERLRFSQKPLDKNATVVFISGKITEHKVEKSEIQLHRTEEGRLTGTVVISTANEPQESSYLSSSLLKNYESDKAVTPRYPSRNAPASEYAKYRQQILDGVNQNIDDMECTQTDMTTEDNDTLQKEINADSENSPKVSSEAENVSNNEYQSTDGVKIMLTGAQKCGLVTKDNTPVKKLIERQFLQNKIALSGNKESQSTVIPDSCSSEAENKAQTIAQLSESGQIYITESVKRKSDLAPESNVKITNNMEVRDDAFSMGTLKGPKDFIPSRESHDPQKCRTESNFGNALSKSEALEKVIKGVQSKNRNIILGAKDSSSLTKAHKQINSLALGPVTEIDVFTELVPPPPQFAAAEHAITKKHSYSSAEVAIAPPPEFSDNTSRSRNRNPQMPSVQRKNHPSSYHSSSKSIDLNLLKSLQSNPSNIMQLMQGDKKLCSSRSNRGVSVHLPCTSGYRHSHNISEHSLLYNNSNKEQIHLKSKQKEFRFKLLQEWTANDISDWLDSLFLPEYKQRFSEAGITGAKLLNMDSNDLMGLGVKQMGHRLNMERSLKRYLK